jgi:hypothetical protein
MSRKLLYISHELRSLGASSSATNTSAKSDGLASYFALEGSKDKLVGWGGRIENVEAGPVGMRGRCRQSVEGVPEERGGVGEIAVGLGRLVG